MKRSRRIFHAAVFVMLLRGDEVLLIRRANTGYRDGQYTLPAGHLDGNESAVSAAIREAREEVGVTIAPEDAHVVGVMHRGPESDQDFEYVDFYVSTQRWEGDPRNNEPEKCDAVIWAPRDRLPDTTISYVEEAIASIQRGQWFGTFGLPA